MSLLHKMFQDVFEKLEEFFNDEKDLEFSEEEKSCINEKISSKLRYNFIIWIIARY